MTTLLKRELLFIPVWGWALALLKPIAINRGNPVTALRKALKEGEDRIKNGFSVLNFAEGTRKNPGEVGGYARSGFELAKKMKVPVLPLVHNSGDCWPAHRFLKFPGKIKLVIGNSIENINSSAEAAKQTEDWARKRLNEIRLEDN
jgi:1-acyl-sn-glycerol-3-phosphate acyltransferase